MNKVWKFLNDVRIHAIILFPLWLSRVQIESGTYRMTISFILIKVDFYLSLPWPKSQESLSPSMDTPPRGISRQRRRWHAYAKGQLTRRCVGSNESNAVLCSLSDSTALLHKIVFSARQTRQEVDARNRSAIIRLFWKKDIELHVTVKLSRTMLILDKITTKRLVARDFLKIHDNVFGMTKCVAALFFGFRTMLTQGSDPDAWKPKEHARFTHLRLNLSHSGCACLISSSNEMPNLCFRFLPKK